MKKVIYTILVIGLVFILGGCSETKVAESQTKAASSTTPVRYRITYPWRMLSNDSVGNEWTHTVTCDGQVIKSGYIVTAVSGSVVTMRGTITENDKHPDSGSGALTLTLADGAIGTARITVREGHGQYAGNTAEWALTCQADREE